MKSWLESNTVRELGLVVTLGVLGWLLVCLQTRAWDVYALGLAVIPSVIAFFNRLRKPDVVAPPLLGFLNAKGPGA